MMKALRREKGFTLIELMVVVAIIGILAAIAIPQFATYRQKGYDARAESDIRNGATAEEAYFASNGTYLDLASTSGPSRPTTLPGFSISDTVSVQYSNSNGNYFTGTTKSGLGSGVTCNWNSSSGGFTGCS